MDLCAEMLSAELAARRDVSAEVFEPRFSRRLAGWRNGDRLLNRFCSYPRQLRDAVGARGGAIDAFHLVDHSYSQLLLELPAGRAGTYCHDLDTFRCVIDPAADPRPPWFRAMAGRILRGFRRAAVVFHATDAVRDEILRHGLIDAAKLVKAPPGVAPEFTAAGEADAPRLLDRPYLLHVGSCVARKRIDVLLAVFERLRATAAHRALILVKVGGDWTAEQLSAGGRFGHGAVRHLRDLDRAALAALYRRCALVLQPSESEGFGLPVVEAIACGATVLASDLPVLREVAGNGAAYAPVGDVESWAARAGELLAGRGVPTAEQKRSCAARYSWSSHAATIVDAYRRVLG